MSSTKIFSQAFLVILETLIILLFLPWLLGLTLLLLISNRGQVFFVQERIGQYGKPFRIIKFKTMRDTYDPEGRLLSDHQRITPLGKFLRKSSLDELPQFINILLGDMRLIGPRPLLPEYLPLYSPEQARRHEVKPGITGWAQINGRNSISWPERLALDVWYVDHRSATLDLKIMAISLWIMFCKKDGDVLSEKFPGQ
ncbi:MAG: sugar transferase [Bacteroidia bacterium]|nr:sugar transferase [Bacteroidia bacterium]